MTNLILPYIHRTDTLAYLKSQPLFTPKACRDVRLPMIIKPLHGYLNSHPEVSPESEAIDFYAGNAVFAEITKRYAMDEPLPPEVLTLANWYLKRGSEISQRLLYYLVLIISRESRHACNGQGFKDNLEANFGEAYKNFHGIIKGAGSSMAAKTIFLNSAPDMSLGEYADAISYTFHKGSFAGGFGGKAWAAIADVFKDYVNGNFSAEMTTDVSWALCHNNGPIFNKGMTYCGYDNFLIKMILDVQRSGQIPELVINGTHGASHISALTTGVMVSASGLWPDVFKNMVDWQAVESAGAVQSYGKLKSKQLALTPGKKVYWVTPNNYVEVYDRKVAA